MLRFATAPHSTDLAFSPDGRLLAVADFGTAVHLHDAYTGRVERLLRQLLTESVTFAPDGVRLAAAARGSVHVWSVSAGRWLCELPAAWVGPTFLPCGKRLVTVGGMADPSEADPDWCRLWFWAALTGELLRPRLQLAYGPITRPVAVFAPADGPLTVVTADRVRRFDPTDFRELATTHLPKELAVTAALPTAGGIVVAAGRVSGRWLGRRRWRGFGVIDADGFRPAVDLTARPAATCWAPSPDGRLVVRAEGDTVHTFDLSGGHVGGLDPGVGPVTAVAFAADGLRLAAAGRAAAAVWDADG